MYFFKNCHNLQRFFLKIIRSCLEVSIGVDPTGAISCYLGSWGVCFLSRTISRWWFQLFLIFLPNPGEMIQFDEHIFKGVKTTN